MSRKFTTAFAALILAGSASLATAQERVVNVYNWSDYIDASILEDFTKETGIKVVYDVFDSNEIVETKLLAGGTGYDVVVPTGDLPAAPDRGRRVPEARQVEAAEPVQYVGRGQERISEIRSRQRIRHRLHVGHHRHRLQCRQGEGRFSVPTIGPAWDVIFKPEIAAKFKDCGIHVLDAPTDVCRLRLTYLGLHSGQP